MHFHTYHPRAIDLVTVTAAAILAVGFACAPVALWSD
jgi:hypothetical protein